MADRLAFCLLQDIIGNVSAPATLKSELKSRRHASVMAFLFAVYHSAIGAKSDITPRAGDPAAMINEPYNFSREST